MAQRINALDSASVFKQIKIPFKIVRYKVKFLKITKVASVTQKMK